MTEATTPSGDAPERVTLSHSQYAGWYAVHTAMRTVSAAYIEYVRVDLYDAAIAEQQRLAGERDDFRDTWLELQQTHEALWQQAESNRDAANTARERIAELEAEVIGLRYEIEGPEGWNTLWCNAENRCLELEAERDRLREVFGSFVDAFPDPLPDREHTTIRLADIAMLRHALAETAATDTPTVELCPVCHCAGVLLWPDGTREECAHGRQDRQDAAGGAS